MLRICRDGEDELRIRKISSTYKVPFLRSMKLGMMAPRDFAFSFRYKSDPSDDQNLVAGIGTSCLEDPGARDTVYGLRKHRRKGEADHDYCRWTII